MMKDMERAKDRCPSCIKRQKEIEQQRASSATTDPTPATATSRGAGSNSSTADSVNDENLVNGENQGWVDEFPSSLPSLPLPLPLPLPAAGECIALPPLSHAIKNVELPSLSQVVKGISLPPLRLKTGGVRSKPRNRALIEGESVFLEKPGASAPNQGAKAPVPLAIAGDKASPKNTEVEREESPLLKKEEHSPSTDHGQGDTECMHCLCTDESHLKNGKRCCMAKAGRKHRICTQCRKPGNCKSKADARSCPAKDTADACPARRCIHCTCGCKGEKQLHKLTGAGSKVVDT